jgi:hypothetical protein
VFGWRIRGDKTNVGTSTDTPVSYNQKIISGLKSKADHNKIESQLTFALVVGASLAAPLFVSLGEGWLFGKVIPASLSLAAAAATSWLQLRKPQRLWALYRQAQRRLEDEQIRHRYRVAPYERSKNPDKLLVSNTASIALEVHYKWEGFVPDPDALGFAPMADRKGKKAQSLGKKKNE